jgi:hypothetical protein
MARAFTMFAALTLAAALAPAAVRAEPAQAVTYDLQTRQTDTWEGGEWDGRLRIQVSPGGIVSGTFMNSNSQISNVVGGLDGSKLWIDLGSAAPTSQRLFWGTFSEGKLVVSAGRGLHAWTVEGTSAVH